MHTTRTLLAILTLVLALSACKKKEAEGDISNGRDVVAATQMNALKDQGTVVDSAQHDASFNIATDRLIEKRKDVRAIALKFGGKIHEEDLSIDRNGQGFATYELRIPSQNFFEATEACAQLGKLTYVSIHSRSLTDDFAQHKRDSADQRRIDSSANRHQDSAAITASVYEHNTLNANRQALEQALAFGTIRLHFATEKGASGELRESLDSWTETMWFACKALIHIILFVGPFALGLGVVIWGIRRILGRGKTKGEHDVTK